MEYRVSSFKRKINILATIITSIIILIFVNYYPNTLKSIGILSLFCYFIFFVSWSIQNKNIINYYTLFLVFTYFFFFGQFFLLVLGIPMESGRTISDGLIPFSDMIKTAELIINSMILLHFGVLISSRDISKYLKKRNPKDETNVMILNYGRTFKKISFLFFIVSIIPSFIILTENLMITLTQGYGAIFKTERFISGGFNNILKFISLFTIPSFLMMLVSFEKSKYLKYIIFTLIVYLGLYFLSGSRLSGVLLLSGILLIKQYWYKPFKFKGFVKLVFISLIGFTILSLISNIRNEIYLSDDTLHLVTESLKDIIIHNPIFEVMEEAGYTFLATATVVTYSPSVIPFRNGVSYLNSVALIFPNLFWDVHPAALTNTDIVFKGFLTQYGGIGSSFIAEAYWNFGYGSLVFVFFFGILIGFLTKKIAKYSWYRNDKMFYLSIYIAQVTLFYVRSDTISFWRNLTYYGIVPLVLVGILSKRKIGNSNE